MQNDTVDFLIIGAGVIGLNLALSLKRYFSDSCVCVIEKESEPGLHASGRNSGVLHAGFYYTADSRKARFCKEGNERLTEYCLDKGLPINRCGKLVVAADASELEGLNELLRRGQANGVELVCLDEDEAKGIEPRVKTFQKALFSPTTATVSPQRVMQALIEDVKQAGVDVCTNEKFVSCKGNRVKTSHGAFDVAYVVNAAGLYADKIAMQFGFSEQYRILPFKGLYLYANASDAGVRTNIYPVPNLQQPFLGVHFTLDVEGKTKIGPTAIPAFWREQYGGMENFDVTEMLEILTRDLGLLYQNHFGFRRVAIEEMRKLSRRQMVRLADKMLSGLSQASFDQWGKPGIRAQLVNIREKKLEMDFQCEGDDRSFHVLNAVSPAFTCSMPFADFLRDEIVAHLN